MKKKMCIFVLYDKNGIVDRYTEFLMVSIQNFFYKIVIVINGFIRQEDYIRLQSYSEYIFVRKNKGFDAEAYKDVFLKYIPREEWYEYDEITLINDTFYGPFYPLENMWEKFDQIKTDFWGITRHPIGVYSNGEEMPSHIQGYFLTVRKNMLQSQEFLTFWEEMPDLNDVADAIRKFEVRFTTYFVEHGFIGKALMDLGSPSLNIEYNKNPYLTYNLWLIRDNKIPFLKKKSLLFQTIGFEETINTIEYIEKEKLYDTTMIWDNIFRLSKEEQFQSVFNYNKMEEFYYNHSRIFIYGAGKYGQRIRRYFEYRKWSYVSFLVSRDEDKTVNCEKYSDIMFDFSDGIILALNNRNLEEVLPILNKSLLREQIFIPENR